MHTRSAPGDWNAFGRANAAQRWRRQSAAMGRHMTEAIVAEAKVEPGVRVLDVACGTGEPAISIALLLNGTGLVFGVDISPEPLKIAEKRARERGLVNVRFQQADVHSLPFAGASFDRVTCRLGIMFFSDLARALSEIHRVLKPGGRVALLAWGPMEQPYFESTIGAILRMVPGSALPASGRQMFKFGEAGVLAAALQAAGFRAIEEEFRVVPWSWPGTPEEVWDYFQEVTIPFRPLIDAIPGEQRRSVNAEVLRAIGPYYDGVQVNFTATICLASASRAGLSDAP
jgi:ubiquinone/menaquinone biosynthesis C-methylase UbiE